MTVGQRTTRRPRVSTGRGDRTEWLISVDSLAHCLTSENFSGRAPLLRCEQDDMHPAGYFRQPRARSRGSLLLSCVSAWQGEHYRSWRWQRSVLQVESYTACIRMSQAVARIVADLVAD